MPICCMITFLLIGIEELGMQIEEPFSILPLEGICTSVETNVSWLDRDQNGVNSVVDKAAPNSS